MTSSEQIFNTLVLPYLNHAVRTYESGYASVTDIDAAMRFGCGYPKGPLTVVDEIGAAQVRDLLAARYAETGDPLHQPADLLEKLVADGRTFADEAAAAGEAATAEDAAAAYAATVRSSGTGDFDVLMLGVGPDGHIASLFPDHPGLDATDAIAVAVHDSPKPPPDRVTLTFEALNRAKAVWFLVAGEGKADAVRRGLAEEGSVVDTPARGVRGLTETVWFLDSAAASHI